MKNVYDKNIVQFSTFCNLEFGLKFAVFVQLSVLFHIQFLRDDCHLKFQCISGEKAQNGL